MRFLLTDYDGTGTSTRDVAPRRIDATRGIAYFVVPVEATSGDVTVFQQVGNVQTVAQDGVFPLQIVPVVTDVQVESVASDGSTATVLVYGRGFVDGAGEIRFGNVAVADMTNTAGTDVWNYGQVARVSVPLSDAVYGGVVVKTPGGVSTNFGVSLTGVQAEALSGTPADASKASANAGQSVVLQGVGLRADTDIIVTWTTHQGAKQTDVLRPANASADGTTAQLDIPAHYNGVLDLRVLGSASRPELQIVPTVRAVDLQNWSDRIVLIGSGYIEGASTYTFTGSSFADTLIDAADANEVVNVWYDYGQNNSVYLRRSAINAHGFGSVTVTTEGGTSAPAEVNFVRVDLGTNKALGDVAVDRTTGALWALDYNRPYELHRIDPGNGRIVQTIVAPVLTAGEDYAYNHAGLQVVDSAFKLGTTDVPAGSLLLFNGYGAPDGGVAAIDAATGAVIATLRLQENVDLTAGVHDQATGHLWVTSHSSNALKEIDPTSGATLATVALPSGVNVQTHAGLAIDPVSGNFWVDSSNVGAMLHEIKRDGTLVRSVYAGWQTYNEGEAAGLAFDTDGTLLVASTTGVVYKIDVNRDWAATPSATLTQVVATARDGTPANAGQASANVGDVIELRGTNFNTSTSVLFNTRDDGGSTKVVAINPLLISPDGTKLQVRVPTAATTSEIKVVNRGLQNLGFTNWGGQWTDSIYRKVQVSFTAEASTSNVRFTDAVLEDLANESWGLDNVVVRAANGTVVFQDDFETEAQAAWSNTTVDKSNNTFTAFSGRFGNAAQTFSLSGLTHGETYTVEFDL